MPVERIIEYARATLSLRFRILLIINLQQKHCYRENYILNYRKCFENPCLPITRCDIVAATTYNISLSIHSHPQPHTLTPLTMFQCVA